MRTVRRGFTLVEMLVAAVITIIIGGAALTFFISGIDMERANTANALNQQSLRAPYLTLTPMVELADKIEILAELPPDVSLDKDEIVAYISADVSSPSGQKRMILRFWRDDNIVDEPIAAFSHIESVEFSRYPADADSADQLVRFALNSMYDNKKLNYTSDMRSLNRVPVDGIASGPVLKINTAGLILLPEVKWAGVKHDSEAEHKPEEPIDIVDADWFTLPAGNYVVGTYKVLSGKVSDDVEYEWRLYDSMSDIKPMQNYYVIGNNFESSLLRKHYEYRILNSGTTALGFSVTSSDERIAPPHALRLLSPQMTGKYIALAVKPKSTGNNRWVQSKGYFISTNISQSDAWWADVRSDILKDQEEGTSNTVNPYLQNTGTGISIAVKEDDEKNVYLELKGPKYSEAPFFTKKLEEKYFGKKENDERDPEFCLENYTIWIDAVQDEKTSGWNTSLNMNMVFDRDTTGKVTNHRSYGYMLQFDPGMKDVHNKYNELSGANLSYYFNRSISEDMYAYPDAEGLIMRYFVNSVHRRAHGNPWLYRYKSSDDIRRRDGEGWSYYYWGDLAYINGIVSSDDNVADEGYGKKFAVKDDNKSRKPMGKPSSATENYRYTMELTLVTQLEEGTGTNKDKYVPERIFCRVRIYDKPREYNKDKKKWEFPKGTGRSKDMWYSLPKGVKSGEWWLPSESSVAPVSKDRGDVCYAIGEKFIGDTLSNTIMTNLFDGHSAIGNYFGMRVWKGGGGAFEAKIYFIDIAKGFPLDYELPWKDSAGKEIKIEDIMKPISKGGTWNPNKPFDIKE